MSKKYPSLIDRALEGDEEARYLVVERVLSPVFDLAWHLTREVDPSRALCVQALTGLDARLRAGDLGMNEPVGAAVAALLAAYGDGSPLVTIDPFAKLGRDDLLLALSALVADVDTRDLERLFGDDAGARLEEILDGSPLPLAVLRELLDEVSAAVALPENLWPEPPVDDEEP